MTKVSRQGARKYQGREGERNNLQRRSKEGGEQDLKKDKTFSLSAQDRTFPRPKKSGCFFLGGGWRVGIGV